MRFEQSRTIYKTVAFLDTNTIFHCKDLAALPWAEIDPEGPILLLAVATVLSEVDKKKQDGRLGKRARAFNRLIKPLADDDIPISISTTPVRVDLFVPYGRKIDWKAHYDLDSSEGDDRIIAEMLHVDTLGEETRLVVSNDTGFLLKARRHGIKTKAVEDSWLSPPEASPDEKRIIKLEAELAEIRKNEPQFSVICKLEPEVSSIVVRVPSLDEERQAKICEYLLSENPKAESTFNLSLFSTDFSVQQHDADYDKHYEKYATEEIPRFASLYQRYLELHYGQKPFYIQVENTGQIIAEDVHIEVTAVNGWVNDLPIYVPVPTGPGAPVRRTLAEGLHGGISINLDDLYRNPTASHEFDVDAVKRSTAFSARCEDFRQDKSWGLKDGVLFLDPTLKGDCKVIVKISASNLKGVLTFPFSFPKEIVERTVEDLVNFADGELRLKSTLDELELDPYQMDLNYEIDPSLNSRLRSS